jgi:hypothetical protein
MMRWPRVPIAALAASSFVLAGCVGPATTIAAYRGKAVHASDAALSEVETAVLTTRALLGGRVLQAYAETLISTSEASMSSVQGTFDSIQPPDSSASDALRKDLDAILSSGASDLSDLRIAARREDRQQLATLSKQLGSVASKLQAFSKDHG